MSKQITTTTITKGRDDGDKQSLTQLLKEYWQGVKQRIVYETALLIASLPHLFWKWLLLHWAAMYVFRNLAYSRHVPGPRLKDLGFELIPESEGDFWSEVVLYTNGITSYAFVLMPLFCGYAHSKGVFGIHVITKHVNIHCVGHVLRFFTFISTSLPGPAKHCEATAPFYHMPDYFTWTTILTRRSRVHVDPNCGDLVFSGHMFQTTSFCVVMLQYIPHLIPPRWKLLQRCCQVLLISTVLLQPYFVIAARNHYTVDVVISLYVSPMLWWAMEGFYTTQFYAQSVHFSNRFVPARILHYIQAHRPNSSKTSAMATSWDWFVQKYPKVDPRDLERLLAEAFQLTTMTATSDEESPPSGGSTASLSSDSSSSDGDCEQFQDLALHIMDEQRLVPQTNLLHRKEDYHGPVHRLVTSQTSSYY